MRKLHTASRGFTIIELMIATSVFAVVLLLITSGMLEVGRMFYKGITNTNTQEVARIILEDISQAVQFSGESVTPTSAARPNRFCVGSRRYTFNTNVMLTPSSHVLLVDKFATTCNDSTPPNDMSSPVAGSRELMALNMRLADISIQCVGSADPLCPSNTYEIKVRVVSGEDDLLENDLREDGSTITNGRCRQDIRAGTQFCSVSELKTTVTRRIE